MQLGDRAHISSITQISPGGGMSEGVFGEAITDDPSASVKIFTCSQNQHPPKLI